LLVLGGVLLLLVLTLVQLQGRSIPALSLLAFLPVLFMLLYPILRTTGTSFGLMARQAVFLGYLALAGASVLLLRRYGFAEALFPFVLIWICDTGAYAFGRLLGRRRLPAYLSPNKTVEGLGMGLLSACGAAVLASTFTAFFPTVLGYLGAALVVSIAGQLGDLAESALKREAGIKDSSSLLPGHGGLLDRVDSVIAVLPLYVLYLEIIL
jgi:phosphatidate cytidylyltransferase